MVLKQTINNFELLYPRSTKFILISVILFLIKIIVILLQLFRLLCYSKITLEWFPLLNPYQWPFFFVKNFTQFYFNFWSKLVPKIKLYIFSRDLSHLIAVDALLILLTICQKIYTFLISLN